MIDYNELINRISRIQDLSVSEEMLGAYCEGTLSSSDAAIIDGYIANYAEIGELVDSVDNLKVSDGTYPLGYSTSGIDDIDLPIVPKTGTFNPFNVEITPNMDDIGMVAKATAPTLCSITDESSSDSGDIISCDDSFPSNDHSLNIEGDINKGDLLDDLSINNDNSLI